MSSEPISPSHLEPESPSARFSACSSKASGSRPLEISFGRSVISPTPTMTGMRSSDTGEVGFVIFLFRLLGQSTRCRCVYSVIASEAKQSIEQRSKSGLLCRCAPRNDEGLQLLRHQRVHMLHRLDEIFLELLYHGACGFHAVDQADALSDKIADEVARLRIA